MPASLRRNWWSADRHEPKGILMLKIRIHDDSINTHFKSIYLGINSKYFGKIVSPYIRIFFLILVTTDFRTFPTSWKSKRFPNQVYISKLHFLFFLKIQPLVFFFLSQNLRSYIASGEIQWSKEDQEKGTMTGTERKGKRQVGGSETEKVDQKLQHDGLLSTYLP